MHPPTSSERTYDRSALILAWLAARKYRNAHEDLHRYHDAAYEAFAKAFGTRLDVPPDDGPVPIDHGLHGLFLQVARSYEEIRSPFADYLCASREISEIYQKYREPLDKAAASMRDLYMMMLLELFERIWGGSAPHRVSQRELDGCGHPGINAPDPVDYW